MNNIEQQLQSELSRSTSKSGSDNFLMYLADKFSSSDFIKIKNPFKHSTGWTYVDPKEQVVEENKQKQIYRVTPGEGKMRVLEVGEEVVVPGWEAYIALNRLFNEYAQTTGSSIITILNSTEEREKFLDKAFLGVLDPMTQEFVKNGVVVAKTRSASRGKRSTANTASDPDQKPVIQLTDDLGFADSKKSKN
jgi:hypothetical protein|nr:MAG TPA: hypothetical protein [Caudoviricetes sp.]